MTFKNFILLFPLLSLLALAYTNCSQTNFSSVTSGVAQTILSTGPTNSNGGIYGGLQYRVYQHIVPNFTCEGRQQPESILITQDMTNWLLIQNTPTKCAQQNEVPVTGVFYDSTLNQVVYKGLVYTPPLPYVVNPAENPNLPDIKLEDGVCEDASGKCSLLAAVQQSAYVTATANTSVQIPSGTYLMTTPLIFSTYGNSMLLFGPSDMSAFIDGQNSIQLFNVQKSVGQLTFQNLNLQHAIAPTFGAGGLQATYIDQMSVLNCAFLESGDSSFAMQIQYTSKVGQLTVQGATFTDTEGGTLDVEQIGSALIEDVNVQGQYNSGTMLFQLLQDLQLNRASITGSTGIQFWNINTVSIQSSNISGNAAGVRFGFSPGVTPTSLVVSSTTIANNNFFSAPNASALEFINGNLLPEFVFNNSTIIAGGQASDCLITTGGNPKIVTNASTFDDNTCSAFMVSGP